MFLAALHGVSELFPVSSLGHTVLIPALLGWDIDRGTPQFLSFVVALHLGTALALVVFYWSTWKGIIAAFIRSVVRGRFEHSPDEKTAWLLIAGTIPVALLGIYFEKAVQRLFASPLPVSLFLVANAAIMFLGEYLRRAQHAAPGKDYRPLESLSWREGALIGLSQGLASSREFHAPGPRSSPVSWRSSITNRPRGFRSSSQRPSSWPPRCWRSRGSSRRPEPA